jgi:hypothetical protein
MFLPLSRVSVGIHMNPNFRKLKIMQNKYAYVSKENKHNILMYHTYITSIRFYSLVKLNPLHASF